MTWPVSVCDCGAEIVFAVSASTGKTMPMCAAPSPSGGWALTAGPTDAPLATYVQPDRRLGRTLYASHFGDCPNAGKHRKRGRG